MCAASFWEVLVLPGFSRPSAAAGRSSAGSPTVPSTPITKPWGMQAHFPGPLWCVVGKLNGTGDKVPLSLQGDLCESDKGRMKPVVWLGVYARQREIAIWYAP